MLFTLAMTEARLRGGPGVVGRRGSAGRDGGGALLQEAFLGVPGWSVNLRSLTFCLLYNMKWYLTFKAKLTWEGLIHATNLRIYLHSSISALISTIELVL